MIKKFAMLATVAALFVACGEAQTDSMEQKVDDASTKIEAATNDAVEVIEEAKDAAVDTIQANAEKVEAAVQEVK